MFIVLIENEKQEKSIKHVSYGKDIEIIREWVYNYLIRYIENIDSKGTASVLGYKIKENLEENKYELLQEYKQVIQGYIYNSYNIKFNNILTVYILDYTEHIDTKKKYLQLVNTHKMFIDKIENSIKEKKELIKEKKE